MPEAWKNNVVFVLVDPMESGNIGSTARAIKNMGFTRLRLVNPPQVDFMNNEARWFAYQALDVLGGAEHFTSLRDALADTALAAATSRRKGKWRGAVSLIRDAMPTLREAAEHNTVAIVFGNERTGLSNEHLIECGLALYIPTEPEQPSLNLSQAVMITAYELASTSLTASPDERQPRLLLNKAEMEPFWDQVERVLIKLGIDRRGDRDIASGALMRIKQFVGRSGLTVWEMHTLEGVCWQIERRLEALGSDHKTLREIKIRREGLGQPGGEEA